MQQEVLPFFLALTEPARAAPGERQLDEPQKRERTEDRR
jgi:hypothetical protein